MVPNLQSLIHYAQRLTPAEQAELITAVSKLLQQHYQAVSPQSDFWEAKSIEAIAANQQKQPVFDLTQLKADFWPDDESSDDFIHFIMQQRNEDRLHN